MATSSLGRLTLDLAVRLSEFTDGMSRAERETADRTQRMQESVTSFREHLASELGGTQLGGIIDTFNERFGSIEGSITKVGGVLAGMAVGGIAVGLGALSKMAIETAKADSQMVVLANRANTAVESFQVLSKAAEGLGFEQEALASVLADAQEKLGEFSATEGGGAADFFDALRNNTKMTDEQIKALGKTLQGKDGVEAIQLIKDKMDELGTTSQEQRFVFESLASDLTNLMPLFANGGALLDQYGEALRDAGVIKTQEAIEQSKLLAAQTQAVQTRYEGFKSQLVQQMMPSLNALGKYFFSTGEKGTGFGGVISGVGTIAKGVAGLIMILGGSVGILGDTIGQFMAQLVNVGKTAYNVAMANGPLAKAVALMQGIGNAQNMGGDWAGSVTSRFKNMVDGLANLTDTQIGSNDALVQSFLAMNKQNEKNSQGLRVNTKEAEANAKAKEKLAKAEARLVGISGNSGIGSGAHLDIRVSGGDRRLKASELARFQADGKPLTAYRKTSDYGYRGNIGVNGASKYHRGIDFAMPVGTPITTKVPVKNVSNFYDPKGGGYVQRIVFEDGLSVDLLHQSPASKGIKGGSSTSKTTPYSSAKSESYSLIAKSNEDAKREAEQREKERQRQLEQDARDRQSLAEKYYTEEQRINAENEKNMADINRLHVRGTKEYHDALVLENERYLKAYSEYEWKLGEKARAQLALIDKIKDDIGSSTMQSTNDYLDTTMKSSLTPEQYNQWSMQRDYNNQYSSLYGQYEGRKNEINATDERGNFRIDDETERNALLEQARQEHLAKLYTLEADHVAKVKEMNDADNQQRLDNYGSMIGGMTDLTRLFAGENSTAYRVMFAAQKGYALAMAIIDGKAAVMKAWASAAFPYNMPSVAAAISQTGVLQAAMSAVSPKGFKTGGYTGNMGVNDVAGVVHGKEYVLNAMATKRIGVDKLNALNRGDNLKNNVQVNNYAGAAVTAKQENGLTIIDVRNEIERKMRSDMTNPNSSISKSIYRNTTANPQR